MDHPLLLGKLPPRLLSDLLERHTACGDPRIVVGPTYGEDAAVVDMGTSEGSYLVCKADPITFASDAIGWYAVHVNANDIAAMGAVPRWFMSTVLLPEAAATPSLVDRILSEISAAAKSIGVTVIGGHTEVTSGLERTIVAGAMLGEVQRDRFVTSGGARPGDALLLTGGAAIEGTAVLARELARRLAPHLPERELEEARRFIYRPGISVVKHAQVALGAGEITAMHDPTEGGVATGVHELAAASGVGAVVFRDRVPLATITRRICEVVDADPLGVIASGALLMAVAPESAARTLRALREAGIAVGQIGVLADKSAGVVLQSEAGQAPLPRYDLDEAARVLSTF